MARTMYDGVTASALPSGAAMVAGYVDGNYKWSSADWARFPNAVKVQIAIGHLTVADILDVEQGNDMNPPDWVSWVQLCRNHGRDPIIYMNTSTWPSVRQAFTSRGVAEPKYWVAQYDGVATVPSGAVGKQYATNNSYDTSVVADAWFGTGGASNGGTLNTLEDDNMHQQLQLNVPFVATNPSAVHAGNTALCLKSDFGKATVRIAMHLATGWNVLPLVALDPAAGAWRKDLDNTVNSISVLFTAGDPGAAVGLDLIAV